MKQKKYPVKLTVIVSIVIALIATSCVAIGVSKNRARSSVLLYLSDKTQFLEKNKEQLRLNYKITYWEFEYEDNGTMFDCDIDKYVGTIGVFDSQINNPRSFTESMPC